MAFIGADGSELVSGALALSAGPQVALSSPPATLTAGADTPVTFSSQAKHVWVQNNSATAVGVEFDGVSSAGSLQIPGGMNAFARFDVPCTVVHLFSSTATALNGTAGANIVLKGWS